MFFNCLKSDATKFSPRDWLWIEVCQNTVFSKIDITITTKNKKIWNWLNPHFAWPRPATENPTPGT